MPLFLLMKLTQLSSSVSLFLLCPFPFPLKINPLIEPTNLPTLQTPASECISEHGIHLCASLGGTCLVQRDGFYLVSLACVAIGATVLVGYIIPTARRLQALPGSAWKVAIPQ